MTILLTLATSVWAGWQGILLKIAIACVVIWAINALIEWSGWAIPRPIQIIAIALFCILIIFWLFELFNALT